MNGEILLTLTQAFQMVALAPSILVIFYLLATMRSPAFVMVPMFYFLALSAGFVSFLLPAFVGFEQNWWVNVALLISSSMVPALSFLLILQFMTSRVPSPVYWLVLMVPLLGGGPFIYGALNHPTLCLDMEVCFSSEYTLLLNRVVTSSFVFILLLLIVARIKPDLEGGEQVRQHKYWLIVAMIIYNVMMLAIDLGRAGGSVPEERYIFTGTLVKLAFVYMALTSIFRVFTDTFEEELAKITYHRAPLSEGEKSMVEKIKDVMEKDKAYCALGFNRAALAKLVGVKEHQLSRIINNEYGKSFSELANEYRIRDAKERLTGSKASITAVSFDVGFSSLTSFNRVFKELTGVSPSEYRAKSKAK